MKRVAIYSRKSKATDKGESTKIQIKLCKEYFKKYGECKFEIFEDEGYSGGNTNRPSFKMMMTRVKQGQFDVVAVYKVDRIARKITDFFSIFAELEEYNVDLVSVTEGFDPSTPVGKMIMSFLASLAEMERENIRQRVRDNMIELAKKGRWSGGNTPLGYSSIKMIENEKQATYLTTNQDTIIVEKIYELYLNNYSTRKIVTEINKRFNIKTNQKSVCNILYSPVYVKSSPQTHNWLNANDYDVYNEPNGNGYLTYQKTTNFNGKKRLDRTQKTIAAVSMHQGIISDIDWINAQEKLKSITQDPKPRISQFTWLAHLVVCGYCNKPMQVYSEGRVRGTSRFFRKTCTCNHVGETLKGSRLTIDNAETTVLEFLNRFSNVKTLENSIATSNTDSTEKEYKHIQKEIHKLDNLITGLTDKLAFASTNTLDVIMNRIDNLVNNKKEFQERLIDLDKLKLIETEQHNNIKSLHNDIHNFTTYFDSYSLEEKQAMIRKIITRASWFGKEKTLKIKLVGER